MFVGFGLGFRVAVGGIRVFVAVKVGVIVAVGVRVNVWLGVTVKVSVWDISDCGTGVSVAGGKTPKSFKLG